MQETNKAISYTDVEDNATLLINSLLAPAKEINDTTEESEANDTYIEDEQRRRVVNQSNLRKDRIVYLTLLGKDMADPDYLYELSAKLNVIMPVLMRDIHELSDPKVWMKHTKRLKKIIEAKRLNKLVNVERRKKEVACNVLQLVPFNEVMFIDFSRKFDCSPREIFKDIQQFKSLSFWYTNYMSKKPVKEKTFAAIKFARIHLTY